MTRMKRLLVAAGLSVSALALPFVAAPAHAACIIKLPGGCQPCPPPIVVNGKVIYRFICVE